MTDRALSATFAPVWTSRRWLAAAALLWVGCSAIYFLTAPGRIDMFDGGIRHDVTESLIDIGLPAVRDPWFPGLPGRWGLRYAWYELGSSVSAIPFVLVGSWLGHGSLEARQFAFSLTTVPFAAASVALVFLIYGRLGCPATSALAWSLVVAFCTMLWPYAGSSFDAALQAFWLTLGVWAVVEARTGRSFRWAALAGAAFAMLVHVQEAYAVLAGCGVAAWPLSPDRVRARINDRLIQTIWLGLLVGVGAGVCGQRAPLRQPARHRPRHHLRRQSRVRQSDHRIDRPASQPREEHLLVQPDGRHRGSWCLAPGPARRGRVLSDPRVPRDPSAADFMFPILGGGVGVGSAVSRGDHSGRVHRASLCVAVAPASNRQDGDLRRGTRRPTSRDQRGSSALLFRSILSTLLLAGRVEDVHGFAAPGAPR